MRIKVKRIWMMTICIITFTLFIIFINYCIAVKNSLTDSSFLSSENGAETPWSRSQKDLLHIKRVCKFFNVSSSISTYTLSHIHVDKTRKALYCYIPKVASTSWKRIWIKMTAKSSKNENLTSISRVRTHSSLPTLNHPMYGKLELTNIWSSFKKFFLVRHPFHRVLSAYKDKFEQEDKESKYNFHEEIGKKIEQKYRGNITGGGHNITFHEYMSFISELGDETQEQQNEHWRSHFDVCSPCAIKYDFIGRHEHLIEDSDFILSWINASNIIGQFPDPDRPFYVNEYDKSYVYSLDQETKLLFFRKYLLDFIGFRYNFV